MRRELKTVFKPEVRALRAYSLKPRHASIKINQNENPWELSSRIKAETLKRFDQFRWSRYPAFVSTDLQERLARFADWKADGVLAGNGSNELIQAVLMVTVSAGKRVLISEPTFSLYRQLTTILGGTIESVPMTTEFQYDTRSLIEAVKAHDPEVVIICSPNNPTGTRISDNDLREILNAAPGLVVIDEAYHEFFQNTVVPLLTEYDNLVVLRTFSKAMALASLRVGYLLAGPELVGEIRKALLPYNLNLFSQTAAKVALELYETELLPFIRKILAERQRLYEALNQLTGVTAIPSQANFMIVRCAIDPQIVFEHLLQRDILIRDVSSYPMLKQYFRISVGTTEENDKLIQGLKEIVS